jgi:hypothetical protein
MKLNEKDLKQFKKLSGGINEEFLFGMPKQMKWMGFECDIRNVREIKEESDYGDDPDLKQYKDDDILLVNTCEDEEGNPQGPAYFVPLESSILRRISCYYNEMANLVQEAEMTTKQELSYKFEEMFKNNTKSKIYL